VKSNRDAWMFFFEVQEDRGSLDLIINFVGMK